MLPVVNFKRRFPDYSETIFDDFFPSFNSSYSPEVNVVENGDEFKIEIAVPGALKSDFNLVVEDDVLTVSAERKHEKDEKNDHYLRKEFGYESFKRSFGLPESVNQDEIKASYKNGILNVDIPKKEEAKPRPAQVIKIS